MEYKLDVSHMSDDELLEKYVEVDNELYIEESEGNHLSDEEYKEYAMLYRILYNELEKRRMIRFLRRKKNKKEDLDESLLGSSHEDSDIDEAGQVIKRKNNTDYQF